MEKSWPKPCMKVSVIPREIYIFISTKKEFPAHQRPVFLYKEYHISNIKYDQELAVVLRDIFRHYTAGQKTTAKPNKTPWGTIEQKDLPVRISMLLLDTTNPI